MNKQKGFAPILIVIIIAVLVGGYLIYQNQTKPTPPPTTQLTSAPTPTPESTNSAETANWKTYNSTLTSISFKYPPNWVIEGGSDFGKKQHHSIILIPEGLKSDDGTIPIKIQYRDNPDNLSLEQFDKKINENANMPYPLFDKEAREVTFGVDNITAYYSSKANCSPFYCYKYTVLNKSKVWEFFSQYASSPDKYKNTFNQIISTFKFLP